MSPWLTDWKERTLGSFAEARGGTGFPMAFQGRNSGQLPFYKVSDMNGAGNATWMHRANNYISKADLRELGGRPFDAKTIVFPKVGATIYTNKKRILASTAVVDNNVMGVTVTDRDACSSEFLYFWFLHIDLAMLSSPGTVPSITSTRVKAQKVMLPPRGEQDQITSVLSAVQRAIERQERLIALTAELKKALMHKLFTEGTRGEPPKQTEIGPVPDTWAENCLGAVARFSSGGTPSREVNEYWVGGTIPWVKTTEVNYYKITETEERITQAGLNNSSAKVFPVATLLMAMYGQGQTRGRVGILGIAAATNQACVAIIPNSEDVVSTNFLYYFLEFHYENLRQRGHGANQTNLSMTLLKHFPVYYPERREQQAIIAVLRAVDEKLAIHKRERIALAALFRTFLDQLMTAQIRVNDLDLSALEETVREPAGVA
jgi:type I restriction enzyme S subunit